MQIRKLFGISIPMKALIFSMPILILIIIDTIYTVLTAFSLFGQIMAYIYTPGFLIQIIIISISGGGLHDIDPINTGIFTCLFYYLFIMVVLFILKKIKVTEVPH